MSFVKNSFFENLMQQANLPKHPILVVGVSGGSDSLYLTLLLNDWVRKNNGTLYAVTVDHALRKESAAEAHNVHTLLEKFGISHQILVWNGEKPKTRIEEKAREKRYELLCNFCKQKKAYALCLAHHQEDQAETFFLRLARSSGVKGLSSMHIQSYRNDIMILRPLLTTPKSAILDALKKHHISWTEDPMNHDTEFERVRWRQFQPHLTQMGLSPQVITQTTFRLSRANDALTFYTQKFIQQNVQFNPENYLSFSKTKFGELPDEIRARVIEFLISSISRDSKSISLKSIEKIVFTLPKYATLKNCQWAIKGDTIFIAKEARYLPPSVTLKPNAWSQWGPYFVFSLIKTKLTTQAPKKRAPNIPYLVQKTFPHVDNNAKIIFVDSDKKTQKELEKSFIMDYKNHKQNVYLVWK